MDSGSRVEITNYEGKQLLPELAPESSNSSASGSGSDNSHRYISHVINAPRMVVLFVAAAVAILFFRHFTSSLQLPTHYYSFSSASTPIVLSPDQSTTPTVLSPDRYNTFSSSAGGRGDQSTIPIELSPDHSFSFAAGGGGDLSSTPIESPLDHNSISSAAKGDRIQSATPSMESIKKENALDLGSILKNAAMEDKTVIITTLNKAWAEPNSVFDLFLESFRIGDQTQRLLKHLVVITLDEYAYTRCSQIHSQCYAHDTNGTDFSGEAHYMKPDYLNMMWWRLNFPASILDLGYNFIFTDTDIMWFRDPFPYFRDDADFQIACDTFNGNAFDINNRPNAGFKFVKSNNKTVEFYKLWCAGRERFPGLNEQDVLNKIKYDVRRNGLRLRFLDTAYFGGFCQVSKDLNKVCTMHANCCIGLGNKVFDLGIMLNDWRKYMLAQMNDMAPQYSSWTVPQRCGLATFRQRPRLQKKKVRKDVTVGQTP